eukprot:5766255-Prymnesium_polylepis.1
MLQQRRPTGLPRLEPQPLELELLGRQWPIDQHILQREEPVELQHAHVRVGAGLSAQPPDGLEVERAARVRHVRLVVARRQSRRSRDAHAGIASVPHVRLLHENIEVEARHHPVVVALVGPARPPCAWHKMTHWRVGRACSHDAGMADAEAALLRVGELARLDRANELARHLRHDRLPAKQSRDRDQIVDHCVQAAEAHVKRVRSRKGRHLPGGASEPAEGSPSHGREREHARRGVEWLSAWRQAERVQLPVPEAVRSQPEEPPRLAPTRVRETLPHVGDVHVGERRRHGARPIRLRVGPEGGEPRRGDHQTSVSKRAVALEAQRDAIGQARRECGMCAGGGVGRWAERHP